MHNLNYVAFYDIRSGYSGSRVLFHPSQAYTTKVDCVL